METMNVKEARSRFKTLLDRVAGGEEIMIQRRGKVVARLVPPKSPRSRKRLPSLKAFRASIHVRGLPLSSTVVQGRQGERY